jgi:hypothetical protein
MKFPYGISDFQRVITGGYFYVDRTGSIPQIEASGDQLLFLRPRRFGKSLLLSMLENYYDLGRAGDFEQTFGRLAIGAQPTPLHNRYFVLKLDFSTVQTFGDASHIAQLLYNHINTTIHFFASYYHAWLSVPIEINANDALASLQSLAAAVRQSDHRLYLLIDEYDNFANEVLMSSVRDGQRRYEELVKGEGVFKSFFKVIKSVSSGGGLERVFITGVSPVVMADISSGYNVAKNIYLRPEFNGLCGFTESEIADALQQVANGCHFDSDQSAAALTMMRTYYNGYRFHHAAAEPIYNPTLALYFLETLQDSCHYPDEMLDANLAMDRSRIAYIAQLGGAEQLVATILNETQPLVTATLAQRFGAADILSGDPKGVEYLAALLYYLGVLTLDGRTELNEYLLRIPNVVVRELYATRLRDLWLPSGIDQDAGRQAARTYFLSGDLQPVCDFIERKYFTIFDNRDYLSANELTIKTVFLTLLFNDKVYLVDSETAIQRTYADLTLMRRPDMLQNPQLADLLLEFKFVKLSEIGLSGVALRETPLTDLRQLAPVQEKLQEARRQLQLYSSTLQAHYGPLLRLRTYAVVALGFDRLVWEDVA